MPKDSNIELTGKIEQACGGGKYRISIAGSPEGSYILGQLAGRMKQNHIQVIPGDSVIVSVSPYDVSHGIITQRVRK